MNAAPAMQAGDRLFNGARATAALAAAYNAESERIAAWERDGLTPPEHLLNGRHNLLMGGAMTLAALERKGGRNGQ